MISLETTLAFFSVSVLLALTPGPDNVFVLLQSAMRGRAAGMLVVLGLCTGLLVHTTAVALGLAAVFAASATAFSILKFIGAGYLLYLAWQAFRAPAGVASADKVERISSKQMYTRGIIMNLTNPKVAIFFLAFLPQFAHPQHGSLVLQMLWLGAIFIIATLLVFGAIAYFSGAFGAALNRSPRAQLVLNKLSGIVFAGLAIRLASAQR
ncbi:MAG TPA: LysE family translocator [Noviherbaspirillum sp.]|nr:LysE family translocator [Noviherbaspirillum sp.]